jgi:hypothetical protein
MQSEEAVQKKLTRLIAMAQEYVGASNLEPHAATLDLVTFVFATLLKASSEHDRVIADLKQHLALRRAAIENQLSEASRSDEEKIERAALAEVVAIQLLLAPPRGVVEVSLAPTEPADTQMPPGENGVLFWDKASNRRMMLSTNKGPLHGWILYQHPDGFWCTLREATVDDLRSFLAAGLGSFLFDLL